MCSPCLTWTFHCRATTSLQPGPPLHWSFFAGCARRTFIGAGLLFVCFAAVLFQFGHGLGGWLHLVLILFWASGALVYYCDLTSLVGRRFSIAKGAAACENLSLARAPGPPHERKHHMQPLNGRVLELVTRLDALGPRPSLIDVAQALKGAKLTRADVASYVHHSTRSYNRRWWCCANLMNCL